MGIDRETPAPSRSRGRACRDCACFDAAPDGTKGLCKTDGPKALQVTSDGVGGPQTVLVGAWPIVGAKAWCDRFKPDRLNRLEGERA